MSTFTSAPSSESLQGLGLPAAAAAELEVAQKLRASSTGVRVKLILPLVVLAIGFSVASFATTAVVIRKDLAGVGYQAVTSVGPLFYCVEFQSDGTFPGPTSQTQCAYINPFDEEAKDWRDKGPFSHSMRLQGLMPAQFALQTLCLLVLLYQVCSSSGGLDSSKTFFRCSGKTLFSIVAALLFVAWALSLTSMGMGVNIVRGVCSETKYFVSCDAAYGFAFLVVSTFLSLVSFAGIFHLQRGL